jgi:lipoprotein-anchoring transpeptidase ErfK/SrfK
MGGDVHSASIASLCFAGNRAADFGMTSGPQHAPHPIDRRQFLAGAAAVGAACGLSGCAATVIEHPVVERRTVDPAFHRALVDYDTREPAGTIIVDPASHFLYTVRGGGQAMRYGVGTGTEGAAWSGVATIRFKREWPDWYPTREMLERRPDIEPMLKDLQSGRGIPGGPENPLGARAMYLWQGTKDTLYRIHGTTEPWTIGQDVSSGCIRMTNEDVTDLYDRTLIGTRVIVLPRTLALV